MLVHRLRRWPNIKTTLVRYLVLAGYHPPALLAIMLHQIIMSWGTNIIHLFIIRHSKKKAYIVDVKDLDSCETLGRSSLVLRSSLGLH